MEKEKAHVDGNHDTRRKEHAIGLLWDMYKQEQDWRRHHERLRSNATTIILALASAITTVILYDKSLSYYDIPLEFMVAVLGIVGVFLCDRHYERAGYHTARGNGTITKMFQQWPEEYHAKEIIDLRIRKHENKSRDYMLIWKMRRIFVLSILRCWDFLFRKRLSDIISKSRRTNKKKSKEQREQDIVYRWEREIGRWVSQRTGFLGHAWGLWKTIHYVVFLVGVGLIASSFRAPPPACP